MNLVIRYFTKHILHKVWCFDEEDHLSEYF